MRVLLEVGSGHPQRGSFDAPIAAAAMPQLMKIDPKSKLQKQQFCSMWQRAWREGCVFIYKGLINENDRPAPCRDVRESDFRCP